MPKKGENEYCSHWTNLIKFFFYVNMPSQETHERLDPIGSDGAVVEFLSVEIQLNPTKFGSDMQSDFIGCRSLPVKSESASN